MVGSEHGYVMLLTHPKFKQFTPNAIADAAKSTEVLVALSCENRGRVDDLVSKAVAAGGKTYSKPPGLRLHVRTRLSGPRWPCLGGVLHGRERRQAELKADTPQQAGKGWRNSK